MLMTTTALDLSKLDKRSADSAYMFDYWSMVQTIVGGTDKMIEAGTTYLPKFPLEEQAEYNFRLANAKFTNIYRDSVEGLSSKPFEKEVELGADMPERLREYCEDVDGAGNNLTIFAIDYMFNAINSALDWLFIDYSRTEPALDAAGAVRARTRDEEAALGLRPFWSRIAAINVLDVKSKVIGGKERITFMKVLEPGEVDHIRIMTSDGMGFADWSLYEKLKDEVSGEFKWRLVDQGMFSIGIIPVVPLITGRRIGRSWRFHPPMKDAADLQIQLYRDESGLNNIKALTGYPMLAGQGVDAPKNADGTAATVRGGPGATLFTGTRKDGGQPGFFEWLTPEAALLTFLKEDVKATVHELRELGRQPLTLQSGNTTVIAAAGNADKANSAVGLWALACKDALENALVITAMWFNMNPMSDKNLYDSIEVEVFTDFEIAGEGGESLTALRDARKNRDISRRAYIAELKRRNILRPEYDADEDAAELLKEVPADDDGVDTNVDPET